MSVLKYVNYCGLGVIGCCFKGYQGFMPGPLYNGNEAKEEESAVVLDTSFMGQECVIIKNGKRICGTGSALASQEVVQDKSYFELRIQSQGFWAVGLASKGVDLNSGSLGRDQFSWVLRADGSLAHGDVIMDKLDLKVVEGDYIGVSFDHIELNFFVNGKNLHCPITGIRGSVYPIVGVDDGCIIDVNFDQFVFPPPPGFQRLLPEKTLL